MANTAQGNTFFFDSTGSQNVGSRTIVKGIVLTATSANAVAVMKDAESDDTVLQLDLSSSGDSSVYDFTGTPILFPGGVKVSTLTNCVLTVIYSNR